MIDGVVVWLLCFILYISDATYISLCVLRSDGTEFTIADYPSMPSALHTDKHLKHHS